MSKDTPAQQTGYFSLDLRALALFRIGLGAVFLLDLGLRARDLQMFYGDEGVLSRALFLNQSWLLSEYQFFLCTGSTWGLAVLFALGALGGLSFMLGYYPRAAALFCWFFTVSLQLRNPIVLDGGDELLRLLLFWCMFLPLSSRASWHSRKHPEWQSLPNSYRSVATAGVTLQYVLLYFFAAYLKTGADWRETGEALYYTLSIDQFATHLGKGLLAYPGLLKGLTFGALATEFALAFLLLLPTRWTWARLIFLVLATTFHLGIALCLHFGIFMLIVLVGSLAFLPGALLDKWWPAREGGAVQDLPPAYRLSPLERVFGGFILFYMIVVNVQSVEHGRRLPGWTMAVARVTYQHQHWHLFAPVPFREDGWFVFEVTDSDGKIWRSLGAEDSLDKPDHVSTTFPNQRWRRWFQNLVHDPFQDTQSWRNSTAYYLARRWLEENPGKSMAAYRLLFMEEMTPPPGEVPQVEMKVLAESQRS